MSPELPSADTLAELERLRAENARLANERDQLRALFDQAPASICYLIGPEHVFTFANPLYRQLVGGRDVVGKTVREALPEIDGQGFYELLDEVYRTGEPFVGQQMPVDLDRRGDGRIERCYLNFVYQAVRDAAGATIGVQVHAVEVTEMVQARQQLQLSEERFRSLVRATSQLVWTTDAEGQVVDMPEWRAYTGQSPEAVRGWGWLEAVHPDDRDRVEAAWRGAVERLGTYEVEYRLRSREGTYAAFVARGTPVLEPDGSVREWIGLCQNVQAQREAAQALRDRDTQYAMVMKATQDAIWDWDLVTDRVVWNDGVESLFAYGTGQVAETAAWWYEHIHPDDAERVVTGIHAVIDCGGQNWSDEYRFRKADGTYAMVIDRGYCVHDAAGRPVRMVGAMHDVTRIRATEAELKASETRFRVLADAMPQQVWTATPDGQLDYVNAQVAAYAGRPVSELLGDRWTVMVHPEDLPGAGAAWGDSLKTGAPYEVFFRLHHAGSDAYRWHVGRALPIRDGEGRITHWYGTNTDVHDQKMTELALQQANESLATQQEELQAQQEELQMQTEELMSQQDSLVEMNRELRASEMRFRQLADAMPQMIFTAEPTGEIDYYNQRWFEYTGMSFEDTRGWNWKPVHHPDDLQRTIDTWSRCVETGELYTIEYRLQRAEDGAYRWHLGRGVPVRDEDGRIVKWYGTNTDIHDQKLAELALQRAHEEMVRLSAQAQAANKMKSEFLANMSHELRTPLNSIIGYTELVMLLGGAGLGQTERSNLEVVLRNAHHLLELINDVLDLSKIEAGKATVHAEPFDPRALVEAVVGTAAPMAREKGLRITAHLAPGVGPIVSDETKVRQILLNLISNAVKFTQAGGVDVTLEPRGGDRWAVIVQDTGIGIAPEHQALVFEEFRQVDASSTRQAGGTGLGLSIARGLTHLLGGHLTLESARGEGSTFTLELPTTLPAAQPAVGAAATEGR